MKIEFVNNSFDEGLVLVQNNNVKPSSTSVGFFDEMSCAGSFFWFDNEHDLKYNLLNGWYARDTEERDVDYYDGVALLSVILDLNTDIETLWSEISEKLITESTLNWSGSINGLLKGGERFEVCFREEFYDFLGLGELDELEPTNVMGSLIEYLDDYCWG